MRYSIAFLIAALCMFGALRSAFAAGLVVLDEPAVVSSQAVRQDLNRALLAVVMKVRGRSAADLAGLNATLSERAAKNLPDKSILLAPFTLKETRISALLPGSNPDLGGGRVAGTFIFEDDFLRQAQLAFALDYQIEKGSETVLINGAGIGENSPMPPVVSFYVVAAKDMPNNFGSYFHSWPDIFSFAVLKGLDLANPAHLPRGRRKYVVFQFVHSRLPNGDYLYALISDQADGQKGERKQTLVNNYDGWKIFRHQVEMDLASRVPLYFKIIYQPRHTGVKDLDGKILTVAAFTPQLGGKMVGKGKPTAIDLADVAGDAPSGPGSDAPASDRPQEAPVKGTLENVALNRPTFVVATGTYSKSKDRTKAGAGAVDGRRTGGYSFHSDKLKNPWWQVDLGAGVTVHRFKIFNRACCADRAKTLRILLSMDGESWTQVHDQGGKTFKTLEVSIEPQPARYVRLQLAEQNYFHLEEVEVWGRRGKLAGGLAKADPHGAKTGAGEGGLAGHWSSPEWKANLDFWTKDGLVLAYYLTNNDRGWLWAKKTAEGYTGYWSETDSNQRCATPLGGSHHWGRVTLLASGEQLTGLWSYCDKPAGRKWTARKMAAARKLDHEPQWALFDDSRE